MDGKTRVLPGLREETGDDRDLFRAIAQDAPGIVFAASTDGRITYFNARWYAFAGLAPRECLSDEFLDRVHPSDAAQLLESWREALRAGEERIAEARLRRADGVYRSHRIVVSPARDADGRIERWLGTMSDIDSVRSAETAFRTLAETVSTLVWAARPDGYVDYYNVRWAERVGEIETLFGEGWRSVVHPEDLAPDAERWKRSIETGEPYFSRLRIRQKSGEYRWFESSANPEHDSNGAIVRWYGTSVDVSENVALRAALRDSDATRELFREFARLTPSLLLTVSADGHVDFVNERWSELLGVDTHTLLATGWRRYVVESDLEHIVAIAKKHALSGEPYVGEWRLKRSDRTFRWFEIRLTAQRDESGAIVRWFGSGFDIDPQRRAIDALDLLAGGGASASLASDVDTLLSDLAKASLTGIADISIFDLRELGRVPRRIAVGAPDREAELAIVTQFDTEKHGLAPPIARAIGLRRSVLVRTVDASYIEANMYPQALRDAWYACGIRSVVIAPLMVEGRVLGGLTLLRTRTSVPFDEHDQRVVEEIARRAGVAIETIRLRENARVEAAKRDERFHQIADAIPQLMWVTRDDGEVEWVNERWLGFTGHTIEVAIAAGWMSLVHPDDRESTERRWAEASENGTVFETEYRLRSRDGSYRWFLGRATPVATSEGRKWYGTSTDVDEARRASRTLEVFAHVGEELSESLGLQSTLDAVMQVVVPDFADWAFITLADESDDLYVRAVYHANVETSAKLERMVGMRYARGDSGVGSPAAIRARQPLLYTNATYEDAAKVVEPAVLEIFWDAVGYDSVLVIPLVVGSVARGTLTVLMSKSDRVFQAADVPFFAELGRRIAPAIANAESYERERHVASTFQQAALPASLPASDGYVFSAVYEAGRAEALVGGDWYDAFALLDGRIVVSIGDVAGSGLRAAVTMANVRQAIRGVAHVHADPELMLEAGDRALRAENPDSFATAFVGVIDPVAETIAYKSAGHSPALVSRPDGTIEELRVGGLPLGLRTTDRDAAFVAPLGPGSTLFLYTDGLTESTHDMLEGERRLHEAIGQTRDVPPEARAQAIYRCVLVDGSRDDVAILSVSVVPRARPMRWIVDARDAGATKRTRDEIMLALGIDRSSPEVRRAAELIFAEIVGNLLRHAPPGAEIVLERDNGRPVMHVRDRGTGFEFMPKLPPDPFSENGRGLFLISALAADFNVTRRPDGGSHARVVFAT